MTTRFEAVVAGTVLGTYNTKAEAEARITEARASFLAMVHPRDAFYVREVA